MADQPHTIIPLTEKIAFKADPHLFNIEQAHKAIDVITGTILNRGDDATKPLVQTIWSILEDVHEDVAKLRTMVEAHTE